MKSKVDLGTYLALSSVFSQLFGEGHWILRIAGDYSVDYYFPASRAEFLVGLFNGYDSHSMELLNHLVRIDADTDTARKGEVLDQSAVWPFGCLVWAQSSVVGWMKIAGLQ